MRVIGIEGKFTNEEYKVHTGRDMKQIHNMDLDLKTIAYGTKQRVDRLNLITRDIVKYYKQGKYLLFCGISINLSLLFISVYLLLLFVL
jgi:hypothetical protein